MDWNQFIGVVALLYAVTDPIGVIPVYLHLIKTASKEVALRIIVLATVSITCLLVGSVLLGEHILTFFNVSLDDFRIAGGLLMLFIAFNMFQAHAGGLTQTPEELAEAEAENVTAIAITPLAFPLLVGPAEISILVTMSTDASGWEEKAWLIAAVVVMGLLVALTLRLALPLKKLMGTTGINVTARIMALIVAAIGVNFIMTGIKNQLPGLTG